MAGAIKLVSDDRMLRLGEVNTNLMCSPGDGPGLDQSSTGAARVSMGLQDAKTSFGLLALLEVHGHFPDFAGSWRQGQTGNPLRAIGNALHDRQVHFLHLTGFKQAAVSIESAFALGQQQDAARLGIKSMDVAQ